MPLWQWPTHPNWRMNGLAEVYLVVLETDPIEHEFSSLLPIYPWLVSQGNRIRIIKYLARPVCLGYHDWHWEPWTGQHASVQGRTQLRYENKLDIAKPKCYSIKNSNILAPRVMIVWDPLHIPQPSLQVEGTVTQVPWIVGELENITIVIHGVYSHHHSKCDTSQPENCSFHNWQASCHPSPTQRDRQHHERPFVGHRRELSIGPKDCIRSPWW